MGVFLLSGVAEMIFLLARTRRCNFPQPLFVSKVAHSFRIKYDVTFSPFLSTPRPNTTGNYGNQANNRSMSCEPRRVVMERFVVVVDVSTRRKSRREGHARVLSSYQRDQVGADAVVKNGRGGEWMGRQCGDVLLLLLLLASEQRERLPQLAKMEASGDGLRCVKVTLCQSRQSDSTPVAATHPSPSSQVVASGKGPLSPMSPPRTTGRDFHRGVIRVEPSVRERKVHQENQKSPGGVIRTCRWRDHEAQEVSFWLRNHRVSRLPTDSAVKSDRCARDPCTKCKVIDPSYRRRLFEPLVTL
jgi:hypothetical protein